MNQMLAAIEEVGAHSWMKLNKGKCETLIFCNKASAKFSDKTLVKQTVQTKYLGCMLNNKNDTTRGLKARIRDATVTFKKNIQLNEVQTECAKSFHIFKSSLRA